MNRFDHILWRINGVLLLIVAISGVSLCGFGVFQMILGSSHERKDAAVVNVDQNTHKKEYLRLGGASNMKGTSVVRMPLYSDSDYGSFSSRSSGGNTRNYLFIDYTDMSSRWLLESFSGLILDAHDLHAGIKNNDQDITGSIYEVIASDNDANGRITIDDRVAAYFGSPDGKQIKEIVPPSSRILSVEQVSDTEVLIIYQQDHTTTAALFSAQNGMKIRESRIPIKENSQQGSAPNHLPSTDSR